MTTSKPLHCTGLSKSFSRRPLFNDLSLDLEAGERLALLGESGSGKSTLLHCLSGVLPVDTGEVWIGGVSLSGLSSEGLADLRKRTCGTVFQFFHLLPTLTARENVELPMQLLGIDEAQRHQRSSSLLERMSVSTRADAFPEQLSGGEMQRVAIARALAHRPQIVFADEPTGNLDPQSGVAVLQLLQEVTEEEKTALLMVTHSEQAASICHRKLTLREACLQSV